MSTIPDFHQAAVSRLDASMAAANVPCDTVILKRGDELTPEPVRWLWRDWLACAKLHILAGAPGQGKTTLTMAMAATVTIGGRWPDGTRCAPGNALIWSGEDDPADTLLPRLIAAGADRARCHFVTATLREGEHQPFDPATDTVLLLAEAERIGGVRLLVVDPVVSAVTGDSHKNTEVRRALQPLVDLAASLDCAVLGITHFSKGGQGTDPTMRVTGSVAFSAVARVVLVAARIKGEDGQDARVLARAKSNIGPDDGGYEYHLEQIEALLGIWSSRIAWGEAVTGTARELLPDEAKIVRSIYEKFVETRSTIVVARWLNEQGITSRRGNPFSKQALDRILANRYYAGMVTNRGKVFPGRHDAIIDPAMWEAVQAVYAVNDRERRRDTLRRGGPSFLLAGLLVTDDGEKLYTAHTISRNGRLHRYYVPKSVATRGAVHGLGRLPAQPLEEMVLAQVHAALQSPVLIQGVWDSVRSSGTRLDEPEVVLTLLKNFGAVWQALYPAEQQRIVHLLVESVVFSEESLAIRWHDAGWASLAQELSPGTIGAELLEYQTQGVTA